ncbi:MAG TPA: hypothetical protein VIH45_11700 [Desulfuromonadaceae bacterium]
MKLRFAATIVVAYIIALGTLATLFERMGIVLSLLGEETSP